MKKSHSVRQQNSNLQIIKLINMYGIRYLPYILNHFGQTFVHECRSFHQPGRPIKLNLLHDSTLIAIQYITEYLN